MLTGSIAVHRGLGAFAGGHYRLRGLGHQCRGYLHIPW
jgi:hypothetical protein